MDPDELFALIVGTAISLTAAVHWYVPLARQRRWAGRPDVITALGLTPPACLIGLFAVLQTLADPRVRGHLEYLALFLTADGAWLAVAVTALPIVLGVSARDDALERRNGPAAAVTCGGMIAVSIVFAAANVGTGDTIWTTLGPAALATAAQFALMLAHAASTGLSERVTVDRDPAAAVRAAGLHIGVAVILAVAVAGNYVSANATLADFAHRGWPAVPLVVVAIGVDRVVARLPWDRRRAVGPAVAVAAAEIGVAAFVGVVVR